jgi:hypothetical protein
MCSMLAVLAVETLVNSAYSVAPDPGRLGVDLHFKVASGQCVLLSMLKAPQTSASQGCSFRPHLTSPA